MKSLKMHDHFKPNKLLNVVLFLSPSTGGFGGYFMSALGCCSDLGRLFIIGFLGWTGWFDCCILVTCPVVPVPSAFHASSKLKFNYFFVVAGDFVM